MADDLLPPVVRIPAGEFIMGADDGEEDERPAHRAYLDEFFIGAHPITNEEYAVFVRETGHPAPTIRDLPLIVSQRQEAVFRDLAAPYLWNDGGPPPARVRHPVTLVGFEDAMSYCTWLSDRVGKPVRLPTEAEWEKAARAGLDRGRYPWGDEIDPSRANFLVDPASKAHQGTVPVGCYEPNAFQLYDMIGNVWEWVSDWYASDYYAGSQYLNPAGPEDGCLRILRGGAWVTSDVRLLRCSYRHKVPADSYAYSIGFRIAYPGPSL